MHTVYILKCTDNRSYVGCTNNFNDRILRHETGRVPSTASRLPVKVVIQIAFDDKYKAFEFEKYLKSGSGRAFMKRHLI